MKRISAILAGPVVASTTASAMDIQYFLELVLKE